MATPAQKASNPILNLSGDSIKQMKSYWPVITILLLFSLSSAPEVVKQTSPSADVDAVIAQLKALDKLPVEGMALTH